MQTQIDLVARTTITVDLPEGCDVFNNETVDAVIAAYVESPEWQILDNSVPTSMNFKDYESGCNKTKIFNLHTDRPIDYCLVALIGECGELANKYKKVLRGDYHLESIRVEMASELGDILWYLAQLAEYLDSDLETVAKSNLKKLKQRKANGSIQGSGDNR